MKKWFHYIMKNKVFIIIILLIVIAFPGAIAKSAQAEVTTIVVAIGIDKEGEEYKVSIQSTNIHGSQQSGNSPQQQPELDVIENTGATLADAFDKISQSTGKTLGFEHCNLIVLGDSVAGEDCRILLDVLYRKANIALNTFIINTDKSSKDILLKVSDFENTSSGSLANNLGFNKDNYSSSPITTLGTFFNDYYSQSKCTTMPFIPSETPDPNKDQTQRESSVKNNGQTAIFVAGKKVAIVEQNITRGINWVNLKEILGNISVNNVNDSEFYEDAIVTLHIRESSVKIATKIENDILILEPTINLYVEIVEVNQDNSEINLSNGFKDYLSSGLKEATRKKILEEIAGVLDFCEVNRIDIYKFKDRFHKFKNSQYKKWKDLHTDEDLYKYAQVKTEVNIYAYN